MASQAIEVPDTPPDPKPPRRSLARHLGELQLLLDQTPSFLILTQGPDHLVSIANAASLTLLGRDRGGVIGQPIGDAIEELRDQGVVALLDDAIASGSKRTGSGVRIRVRDAQAGAMVERRIDFTAQPIRDATNETVGVCIQGLDVTERETAIEALRQADANKDNFLAMLAHEILNPLSACRTALDVLDNLDRPPDPRFGKALSILQRQHAVVAWLVEDLLDISRIRLGKLSLVSEDVAVQDAAAGAIETCSHLVTANSQSLAIELPAMPLWIAADRKRLTQVLTNLLVNAAKFTPRGGSLRLAAARHGDTVEITVADNGQGMTPEQADRAFDLFAQHGSHLNGCRGLGIGLALVRQLVQAQGGTVQASSAGPSQGTTIRMTFPLRDGVAGTR